MEHTLLEIVLSLTVYKQQDMVGAFKYRVQNNGKTVMVTVYERKLVYLLQWSVSNLTDDFTQ